MSTTTEQQGVTAIRRSKSGPIVSLDIGQVLIDRGEPGEIPSGRIPELPPVPGAVEGARRVVEIYGPESVWIVSRCRSESEPLLLEWLAAHGITGDGLNQIPSDHVRFCRERADKAAILREIGASAHVDDRADVLAATRDIPNFLRVLFRPAEGEYIRACETLGEDDFLVSYGWHELPGMLLRELYYGE